MAQKRMFDKAIIDTDKFLDLPNTTKALYFLLCMDADDYGFVSAKKIMRLHQFTEDDLRVLVAKNYVVVFESQVVVIMDWLKHNYLDKNKTKLTEYVRELEQLRILEDRRYESLPKVKQKLNESLPKVKQKFTQYSIEEKRGEENSIEDNKPSKKDNEDLMNNAQLILDEWNSINSTSLKSKREFIDNLKFWLSEGGFLMEDILNAIRKKKILPQGFLRDIDLVTMLRTKNKLGACNYIEQILNYQLGASDGTKQRPDVHSLELNTFGHTKHPVSDLGEFRIESLNDLGYKLDTVDHVLEEKEDGMINFYLVYKSGEKKLFEL